MKPLTLFFALACLPKSLAIIGRERGGGLPELITTRRKCWGRDATTTAQKSTVDPQRRTRVDAKPADLSVLIRGGSDGGRAVERPKLSYHKNMLAGGLSRAAAQAVCHPLNVCKTLLQSTGAGSVTTLAALAKVVAANPSVLTRGLIEQVACSIPNGAGQ